LASGAADGSVRLWNVATGRPLQVWRGHEPRRPRPALTEERAGVNALDMTPDGRKIISAGSERRLRVWDGSTGKEVGTLGLQEHVGVQHGPHVYRVRISPDGKRAVSLWGAHYFERSATGD